MQESDMLLQVRHVSNTYTTRSWGVFGRKTIKPVLDCIDLDMRPGEIVGLVGESGCGKTTLGNSILGLIDYEGEIIIDGVRQDKKQRLRSARKLQAVFQDPSSALNPAKQVGWLMEEPLKIHRLGTKQERIKKVDETLELVGLDPSYKSRRVQELSGGQKQRICIGCALMLEPKLIIADEAISSLDVSVGAQILNLFQDLHRRLGLALLFISHNLKVVYYLCERIAVMYCGQLVELGSAEAIYAAPAHPYTRLLLDAGTELSVPACSEGSRSVFSDEKKGKKGKNCCFSGRCIYMSEACTDAPQALLPIPSDPSAPHLVRCWKSSGGVDCTKAHG